MRLLFLISALTAAAPALAGEQRCPTDAQLTAFTNRMTAIEIPAHDRQRISALLDEAQSTGAVAARDAMIAARLDLGACRDDPDEAGCEAEKHSLAEANRRYQALRAPLDQVDAILNANIERAADGASLCGSTTMARSTQE